MQRSWKPPALLVATWSDAACAGTCVGALRTLKLRTVTGPSNSTSGYTHRRTKGRTQTGIYILMLIAAFLPKGRNNPNAHWWTNEQTKHSIFMQRNTMQPWKRRELTHASIWMNLKHIMVTEIRQTQKNKHCMISPAGWNWQRQRQNGDCQARLKGPGELLCNRCSISI